MRVIPLLAYLALIEITFASEIPEKKQTLLELAKKKFGADKLTRSEQSLFRAIEKGETAIADKADRIVHADRLAWLCTDREASTKITYRGLEISGMTIEGKLNLDSAQIAFPLNAENCEFKEEISLNNAHIRSIDFRDCSVKGMDAEAAEVDENLFFQPKSRAGWINLLGATINGSLECDGAQLNNPQGNALNADGAKIAGRVFLRDGFVAWGKVNFLGATLAGNLECDGAQLNNPQGRALDADGAKITGSVFLRNDFKAQGEINFLAATIGGNLECDRAQLNNPQGRALNADTAKITGSVFLRNGFIAWGEVKLLGATIGGNLDCDGAQLNNAQGKALDADGTKIVGAVFLRNGFTAWGEVNFLAATIGKSLACERAQIFNHSGYYALGAEDTKIDGNVFLRDSLEVDGIVSFVGSNIGGQFVWRDVVSNKNTTLDLRSVKIGILRDQERSWPGDGKLFVDGFTYDRIDEDSPVTAQRRIYWLHQQPRDKFLPQPYEQLAFVLRTMGHESDAKEVLITKNRDYARFTKMLHQEWWWYNVFGKLIGYGYEPSRAFVISLVMIAIGWGLFRLGYPNIISPTDEKAYKDESGKTLWENGERKISNDYPKFNALIFSLESFTPLLKLGQSSNWTPNAKSGRCFHIRRLNLTTGSLLRAYLWFHIVAGWVLTSLWIGGLTGLVKT